MALMFFRRTSASGAGPSPFIAGTVASVAVSSTSLAPFAARKGAERLASSAMAENFRVSKGLKGSQGPKQLKAEICLGFWPRFQDSLLVPRMVLAS